MEGCYSIFYCFQYFFSNHHCSLSKQFSVHWHSQKCVFIRKLDTVIRFHEKLYFSVPSRFFTPHCIIRMWMQQFLHLSGLVLFTWIQALITDYWQTVERWWISYVLIIQQWNETKRGGVTTFSAKRKPIDQPQQSSTKPRKGSDSGHWFRAAILHTKSGKPFWFPRTVW